MWDDLGSEFGQKFRKRRIGLWLRISARHQIADVDTESRCYPDHQLGPGQGQDRGKAYQQYLFDGLVPNPSTHVPSSLGNLNSSVGR
jgi:hypothetical protein